MRKSALIVISGLLFLCACGGGSKSAPPAVSIALTPSAQTSIDQAQTLNFTASVTNDSGNKGVTWSLSGTGCSGAACGTLTNSAALSAVYNAPATVSANVTVSVVATSVSDTTKSKSVAVVVSPNPAITTTSMLDGTAGTAYSVTLNASGGAGALNWSMANGTTLPAGLSLSSSGVVSGMPTTPGTTTFTVMVTDSSGGKPGPVSLTQQLSLTIMAAPLKVVTTTLSNATVGIAYSAPLVASGGTPPYIWTVAAGSSLPSWLTLGGSGTNWTLSGTPTQAAIGSFSLTVTDSSKPNAQSKTQALSVTVVSAAACGSGNESVLKGQYAFSLSGYNSSGFLAEIGSFTADGKGNIAAGMVDSNGALGVQSASITSAGSSYSIGSDNRGCATIVTPFYTFNLRLALETPSTQATAGAIQEWEAGPSSYIASGQMVLQQSIPSSVPNGSWVFEQRGIFSTSQYRTASVGTLNFSGGSVTGGEYDSNSVGVHKTYTGVTGTYTAPNSTTGRFTTTTSLSGITAHRAAYLISGTEFLELVTDAPSSTTAVLIGASQLQTGPKAISGNVVYFASGRDATNSEGAAGFALVTASGSNFSGTVYENDSGTWAVKSSISCSFVIDVYGKVTISGTTGCGTPPVFYLTGSSTGVAMGTDQGVAVGKLLPQTATSVTSGSYFFGTQEIVHLSAAAELGTATLTSVGVTGTSDSTSMASPQLGSQAVSYTLNMNADGTFSTSDFPGVTSGVVVSGSQVVVVNNQTSAYPTILMISTVPLL
jgi:hypothetical protein